MVADDTDAIRERLAALLGAGRHDGAGPTPDDDAPTSGGRAGPPAGGRRDAEARSGDATEGDDPERESPWIVDPEYRTPTVLERLRGARWDVGSAGARALIAVGVVAALVAGIAMLRDRPQPITVPPLPSVVPAAVDSDGAESTTRGGSEPARAEPAPSDEIVVSVVGLVARPGLVHLPAGSRVADALDRAGGTLPDADLAPLNLARRIVDGDQVSVGAPPADPPPPVSGVASGASGGDGAGGVASGAPPGTALLDLNVATETDLDALPGVGPVTAAAIVSWRATHGRFADVDQLGEVDGIGPARLTRLRELVTV